MNFPDFPRGAVCLAGLMVALAARPASAHDGLPEQIVLLTRQLASEPDRADLYVRRADLRRATRDFLSADTDLDRASALDPNLTAVHLVRAQVHADVGRPGDAVAAATRFLEREPRHVAARLLRARAYATLRHRIAAASDYARVVDVQPTPDIVLEHARLWRTAPTDLDAARRALDEGLRRLGPLATIVTLELEALDIELAQKRYDAALVRLEGLAARAARKEAWLARRGAVLEDAGRPEEALVAYDAALAAATALPAHARGARATATLMTELEGHARRLRASAGRVAVR